MTSAPSVTRSTPSLRSLSAARKCNSRHQLHDSSQQLDWHCRWSIRLPIHIPSSRFGWHRSCQRSAQHQLHDTSQWLGWHQLHQRSCKTPGGFFRSFAGLLQDPRRGFDDTLTWIPFQRCLELVPFHPLGHFLLCLMIEINSFLFLHPSICVCFWVLPPTSSLH